MNYNLIFVLFQNQPMMFKKCHCPANYPKIDRLKVSSFLYMLVPDVEKHVYVLATSELQESEATNICLDKPHSCKQAYALN